MSDIQTKNKLLLWITSNTRLLHTRNGVCSTEFVPQSLFHRHSFTSDSFSQNEKEAQTETMFARLCRHNPTMTNL